MRVVGDFLELAADGDSSHAISTFSSSSVSVLSPAPSVDGAHFNALAFSSGAASPSKRLTSICSSRVTC